MSSEREPNKSESESETNFSAERDRAAEETAIEERRAEGLTRLGLLLLRAAEARSVLI